MSEGDYPEAGIKRLLDGLRQVILYLDRRDLYYHPEAKDDRLYVAAQKLEYAEIGPR